MKELKGKQLSLSAKLFAIGWVVIAYVLKVAFQWDHIETMDIIKVGVFAAGVFGTIDLSMIFGNALGRRNVGKREDR